MSKLANAGLTVRRVVTILNFILVDVMVRMTFDSTRVQAARVTLGLGELYMPTTSRLFTPERSPGLEAPRQKLMHPQLVQDFEAVVLICSSCCSIQRKSSQGSNLSEPSEPESRKCGHFSSSSMFPIRGFGYADSLLGKECGWFKDRVR